MNAQELLRRLESDGESRGALTTVRIDRERFSPFCTRLVDEFGLPLSLLFATDDRSGGAGFGVHALFSLDASHERLLVSIALPESDPRFPSLTRTIMAAHWYERYAMDMFGIVAEGHPDPRRLVHHENVPLGTHPLRKDFAWNARLERADVPYPMAHVQGDGIYEIPVGPIHAGIIEPGHFRFNVAGERIITLEGKLFFTHKGVEKLLEGKTVEQALPFVERISGDMAASHALAFCQAVESACGAVVPKRAERLRALVSELERIAMHAHDIANICGNGTGFTVMAAQGFRIKERLVRLSGRVFGNRFWRGFVRPGGVAMDLSEAQLTDIRETTASVHRDMGELIEMGRHLDDLRERLETTGVLKRDAAAAYGAVGVPARASGVDRDVRRDHPYAAYGELAPEVALEKTGDVYARYEVRRRELETSAKLVERILDGLEKGDVRAACPVKDGSAFGAVESWRGELIAFVRVKDGVIDRCVVRDPSFCNWALFGELAPGNIVPDFPLCNKSLDLSYSGTDM
ncbi:MAG TPA: NADH-quinone oxidoreductase subunit C [Patescibacteria group bacterium]|nr:NADH-quinone oxidoreductase subunit C [Patescibacteria group bacterium]